MLRYDTTFGRFPKSLEVYDKGLVIDGKKVPVYKMCIRDSFIPFPPSG